MIWRELRITYEARRSDLPAHLSTPSEAAEHARLHIGTEAVECILVLCCNTRHRLLAWHLLSRGTVNASLTHPRDVFKAAILANASGVILAHNHPSGDPTPSPDDRALTWRLREAGTLLGIDLVDHVIIGDGARYFSFSESGLLERGIL